MKKTIFSVFLMSALIFSGFWPQAFAEEQGDKVDVKKLFENKCSSCHSADRPKAKRKTKEGWETTVMRMKNVNGCSITDEEAAMIINYLAEEYGQ